jgi:hypothetical protein
VLDFSQHPTLAGASNPHSAQLGYQGENVDNELIAKIQHNPDFDKSLHSALIEVIERDYSPEQLRIMQDDPEVLDSLISGMLASMRDSPADKGRLQQAEELMRKSWGFLKQRAQGTPETRGNQKVA